MILITIIQLVIGSIYLGQCPMKPQIPIYNLVAGIAGISGVFLLGILFLPFLFGEDHTCKFKLNDCVALVLCVMGSILIAFYFGWGGVGANWIIQLSFDNTTQFENPQLNTYCNSILY